MKATLLLLIFFFSQADPAAALDPTCGCHSCKDITEGSHVGVYNLVEDVGVGRCGSSCLYRKDSDDSMYCMCEPGNLTVEICSGPVDTLDSPIHDRRVALDDPGCHWVHSTGWFGVLACSSTEFAAGACAGGGFDSSKDCNGGGTVHSLYCCPTILIPTITINVDTDKCRTKTSGFGENVDCASSPNSRFVGLTVHTSCSSGEHPDCHGRTSYNLITCCPAYTDNMLTVGPRSERDCDEWQYGDHGVNLICRDNYVLTGRCGSGGHRDCDGSNQSHGIKCCMMFITNFR